MKKLKYYTEYIKEEFVENQNLTAKLQSFLEGKVKTIKEWFSKGLFNNAALADISITNTTNNLSKDIILEFNDSQGYYQVIFSVSMNDYNEGKFEKCFLKIKKYSMNLDNQMNSLKGLLLDKWDSSNPDNDTENGQINISDFTPEFILDKISKMEDENVAYGSNETEEVQNPQNPQTPLQGQEEAEF